mmetsp:Transcript_49012/g.90829  ORF Transcript_49012/g.90829 Transcript_49012/m.90829 type:complete len:205 (-) Transcript_49012:80-694(-)
MPPFTSIGSSVKSLNTVVTERNASFSRSAADPDLVARSGCLLLLVPPEILRDSRTAGRSLRRCAARPRRTPPPPPSSDVGDSRRGFLTLRSSSSPFSCGLLPVSEPESPSSSSSRPEEEVATVAESMKGYREVSGSRRARTSGKAWNTSRTPSYQVRPASSATWSGKRSPLPGSRTAARDGIRWSSSLRRDVWTEDAKSRRAHS